MRIARVARSRTLITCNGSGRPVTLSKWLWLSPISAAFSFILSTKARSLPARASARTTQASLPDWMIMPRTRSSTFTRSPTRKNICEPPIFQACSLTVSTSSSLSRPSFRASKTR